MRSFNDLLRLLPLVPVAFARPDPYGCDGCCLTDNQASSIAATWTNLNAESDHNKIVAGANELLDPDFYLYSDSDNFAGSPPPNAPAPGTPTATSRANWIAQSLAGQGGGTNPSITNVTIPILRTVHDCNQIAINWRYEGHYAYNGTEDGLTDDKGDLIAATGFDYLLLEGCPMQIKTVWREFNTLEYTYDTGQYVCYQHGNQSRCAA